MAGDIVVAAVVREQPDGSGPRPTQGAAAADAWTETAAQHRGHRRWTRLPPEPPPRLLRTRPRRPATTPADNGVHRARADALIAGRLPPTHARTPNNVTAPADRSQPRQARRIIRLARRAPTSRRSGQAVIGPGPRRAGRRRSLTVMVACSVPAASPSASGYLNGRHLSVHSMLAHADGRILYAQVNGRRTAEDLSCMDHHIYATRACTTPTSTLHDLVVRQEGMLNPFDPQPLHAPSERRLIGWARARSKRFWWAVGLFVACFIAIYTDSTYAGYAPLARLGNALGAGLLFGSIPYWLVALLRSVRSVLRRRDARRAPTPAQPARPLQAFVENPVAARDASLHPQYHTETLISLALPLRLHPWIITAVSDLWRDGHRREAVGRAARSLSAPTQDKLRRYDVSDDHLFQQSFSDDPPKPGQPRLRFVGDRRSPSWTSQLRGARGLAQGCYAGMRNIAAHENGDEWSEEVALEYLASFSVLARWVDECEVFRLD
jgi:hypothetical protein